MSKKDLEIFLYKNKLNTLTLIDILPNLSSKTISNLVNDLNVLLPKSTEQSDKIHVFTDGNCKKNGKTDSKGGYGIFFTEDENSILYQFNTVRKLVENPTNQKAGTLKHLLQLSSRSHKIEQVVGSDCDSM